MAVKKTLELGWPFTCEKLLQLPALGTSHLEREEPYGLWCQRAGFDEAPKLSGMDRVRPLLPSEPAFTPPPKTPAPQPPMAASVSSAGVEFFSELFDVPRPAALFTFEKELTAGKLRETRIRPLAGAYALVTAVGEVQLWLPGKLPTLAAIGTFGPM